MSIKKVNLSKMAKRSRKVSKKKGANKPAYALPLDGMNCRCELVTINIGGTKK